MKVLTLYDTVQCLYLKDGLLHKGLTYECMVYMYVHDLVLDFRSAG
jgi:hypothetical protein